MIVIERIQADITVKGELYKLSNRVVKLKTELDPNDFKDSEKSKFEELGIYDVEITLTYTQL